MIPTSNDLPPKVVLGIKLEGIFMPHARKQRDDLSAKSKRTKAAFHETLSILIVEDEPLVAMNLESPRLSRLLSWSNRLSRPPRRFYMKL
jgi:hypothetical protein